MTDAYVHVVRLTGDGAEVTGEACRLIGHVLPAGPSGSPEGAFVEWRWDGRRLTVRSDWHGFYPCFYFQSEREVCVSPSIFRLIEEGAPTDLDYPGLAAFLHTGYFLAEDTPFSHIRALPPGVDLTWEGGRLTLRGGPPRSHALGLSRDDAIDAFVQLFARAMEQRQSPSDRFVVPLSGGVDSRHILLELCRVGRRPRSTVTARVFPPRQDEDCRIAPGLAQALGLPHRVLNQPDGYFRAEFRKNVLTGLASDEHQWLLVVADYLAREADAAFEGTGCGLFTRNFQFRPGRVALAEAGRFSELARFVLHRWDVIEVDTCLDRLLPRAEAERLGREAALARVEEELRRHAAVPSPVGSFVFWNRGRRELALCPYGVLAGVPTVFTPHLDRALYDLLSGLPPAMLLDGQFQGEAIRRAYPRYAHIPFAEPETFARCTRERDVAFGRDLARHVLSRPSPRWVRGGYLRPRMLAALVSRRYAAATRWFAPVCLYLLQLEGAARGEGCRWERECAPGRVAPVARQPVRTQDTGCQQPVPHRLEG